MDLTVISTYRCNSRCQMCFCWQNPSIAEEEVSLDTLRKLPDGFDNLNISGGEPTLRKDLEAMVDILYPKARIMEISSNGLLWRRLIPIIEKYPNIKVRFSLEGDELISNTIRGEKNGFKTKMEGLLKLKQAGGKDLGFALVIQDENAAMLSWVYEQTQKLQIELATSTLHNAWQFHKSNNHFYDPLLVAKQVEKLISAMLKTNNLKNWFRAYLNLGLIKKILGQKRLIHCTAGKDFAFIDPWSNVWACNVRTDLPMGNLKMQSWQQVINTKNAMASKAKVAACPQNCWMVTTARAAMRWKFMPILPTLKPLLWVIENKLRVSLGLGIDFKRYINYADIKQDFTISQIKRKSFLNQTFKPKIQKASRPSYLQEEFLNQ